MTPDEEIGIAIEHHRAGRLAEAEQIYRKVLRAVPAHQQTLHSLGTLALQVGRFEDAVQWLGRALQVQPASADTLVALGAAHRGAGRVNEAEQCYRAALRLDPRNADGWNNLGNLLSATQRQAEAEQSFRQALACRPDHAQAHANLGRLLQARGKTAEAEACLRRSLEIAPDSAATLNDLAILLRSAGRPTEAEPCARAALRLAPTYAEAHHTLAAILRDLSRHAAAEASCREAIALRPDYKEAHVSLAGALLSRGRHEEAEQALRRAIALDPDYAEAYSDLGLLLINLGRPEDALRPIGHALKLKPGLADAHMHFGLALQDLGRLPEAEAAHRRALSLQPESANILNNLANALRFMGRMAEAEECLRASIARMPAHAYPLANLGSILMETGRLDEAERCVRRALELKPDFVGAHSNLIFLLDMQDGRTLAEQQQERRRWNEVHARALTAAAPPHTNNRDPERRLRVGYVSADFFRHSAYYVFSPVVRRHDPASFEVTCYSGVIQKDDATASLRAAVHGWHDVRGMSDEALAALIRRDGIDILVDLSGHSAGHRLLVFARKPAPVQVTAWGHATGTGLSAMDAFLADPVYVPREARALFAEEVVDLPCWSCYEPPAYMPEVAPLPALAGKPFTFGCINRIEKITDRCLALWGRILEAAPDARLLVKGRAMADARLRQDFNRRLAQAGIDPGRALLLGATPHLEHLRVYNDIDVALDPFPQGGGVSSAEALWMGVPVVTLLGPTLPSRLSASFLSIMQMKDWIAATEDEYVRIALEAARDPRPVARLRGKLRGAMAATPAGNPAVYCRAVEDAYRALWRRWCASGPR